MNESPQVQGEAGTGRSFETYSADPAEIRRVDFAACQELAREIGRLLHSFAPPSEGYRPEPPLTPNRLGPEAGRDLGASSLSDFFALALGGEARAEAELLPPHFPKGPENIRQALAATELEINRLAQARFNLEGNWPTGQAGLEAALRPLEERRVTLAASLTDLGRASRLWPRLKEESDLWLDEARTMWRKARRLEESQALMFRVGFGGESARVDPPRADLTGTVLKLQAEVDAARAMVLEGERWAEETCSLSAELDDLLALAVDGSEPERDWASIGRRLTGRMTELLRVEQSLASAAPHMIEALEDAIQALAEAEKNLAGAGGRETRGRLESIGRGVDALWRSVVERRREMARLYFFLPERLGRPVYLEKSFLSAARVLGRTQALLEDLRHRLSLAGGRLSSSQKLKSESAGLLERFRRLPNRSESMNTVRRRLKNLATAAARPSVAPGRDSLTQALSTAGLEKERLAEQAAESRLALKELGLAKARLVKTFDLKTNLFRVADQERSRLAEENQRLKAQRGELTKRRDELAEAMERARKRFQNLREDLQNGQGADLRGILAEQQDTAAHLNDLRREKDQVETNRRELRDQMRLRAAQEAETGAWMEALAAELNRHQEELAEVSRSRQALSETAAALRRRLDLLAQAHRSLKASLAKRNRRLVRAETEKDSLNLTLTRQKRNFLRLVAARQELRAELGSARLKLADLEKERSGILARLEEAEQCAGAAESEKKLVEDRLNGLELEKEGLAGQLAELMAGVSDGLLPFIAVLMEALWRGEANFQRMRDNEEPPQAGRTEHPVLELRQISQAPERQRYFGEPQALPSDPAPNRENLVARLGLRSQKTGQIISLMKQRYDRRLTEAGQVESALRRDLDRQTRDMTESLSCLAELEPLLDFFFQTAEQSLPPGDANLELARYLREENRELGLEIDGQVSRISAALRAKLAEFQPLVTFLARSFLDGVAELAQAKLERETLETSLAEREALLADRNEEITNLKDELAQADRDLAENDGRLEAAWAGMNYLGARAGDRLGEMRNRLESQTRRMDSLTEELGRRETRIRELEERQDQLSLLYWTLMTRAGASSYAPLPAPPAALAASASPALSQARDSGGFSLGRQVLEGAKKVARRNLFSLILAGSLVLAGSVAEAEASPLEPDLVPAVPPALATRFDSVYIGRPVGLELVESSSRLAGREAVEERLTDMTRELASAQGLTAGEFLRLVRTARGPEATVHLSDFSAREGALALIQPHCPKLARHMAAWPPEILPSGRLATLLKNAADFKPGEGGFWERLFFDLWAESSDPSTALARLLHHMAGQDDDASKLEFAGRLAPFSQLENLGHDRFVDFMAAYIKTAWAGAGGRPRELAARRLAGDLYFNVRFFHLPLTLFVVLIQQEAEEGLTGDLFHRGATLALHHRAAHLARQARQAAVVWEAGRPLLCDLDEALNEKDAFIEAVYRKKLALVQDFNRYLSVGDNLLAALPD
jgi:hypothetical protein